MENIIKDLPATQHQIKQESVAIKKADEIQYNRSVMETRSSFSDQELAEFKELILEKMVKAKTDYEFIKSNQSIKADTSRNETTTLFNTSDDEVDVLLKEENLNLAIRQKKYIQELFDALIRIENKTYGKCRITGKLIAKERLRIIPHTTMSIDSKTRIPA